MPLFSLVSKGHHKQHRIHVFALFLFNLILLFFWGGDGGAGGFRTHHLTLNAPNAPAAFSSCARRWAFSAKSLASSAAISRAKAQALFASGWPREGVGFKRTGKKFLNIFLFGSFRGWEFFLCFKGRENGFSGLRGYVGGSVDSETCGIVPPKSAGHWTSSDLYPETSHWISS